MEMLDEMLADHDWRLLRHNFSRSLAGGVRPSNRDPPPLAINVRKRASARTKIIDRPRVRFFPQIIPLISEIW